MLSLNELPLRPSHTLLRLCFVLDDSGDMFEIYYLLRKYKYNKQSTKI